MKQIVLRLTLPEWGHIVALLFRNLDDGIYTAPRDQYWKRHERLIAKLNAALEGKS